MAKDALGGILVEFALCLKYWDDFHLSTMLCYVLPTFSPTPIFSMHQVNLFSLLHQANNFQCLNLLLKLNFIPDEYRASLSIRVWHFGFETYRFWNFSNFLDGIEKSIGKNWYRKNVLDSVSFRFWVSSHTAINQPEAWKSTTVNIC